MPRDSAAPPAAPQRPPVDRSHEKSGAGYAAAIAIAVLIAAPFTASREGLVTHPYRDPGNPNLWSVCYGETERAMRTYTAQECLQLLNQREAEDYAPGVLKCVPGFADETKRYAFAASIDAAYNGGIHAFCRSRMARSFNAGQWRQGCNGFPGWRATANGKLLRGLELRREAERDLCLKAVPAPLETADASPVQHSGVLSDPTKPSEVLPPDRYQGDNAAIVIFGHRDVIEKLCGAPDASGFGPIACTGSHHGRTVMAIPNPCLAGSVDLYAAILCHELGHANGWPANHGD